MTPELEALAGRVEALTGPDRDVDLAVHNTRGTEFRWSWMHSAFDGPKDLAVEVEPQWITQAIAEGAGAIDALWQPEVLVIPRYTASLDSATSVFPAGTMYRSGHDGAGPDPSLFYCEAITDAPECRKVRSVAFTEATARLACALRARTLHPLSSDTVEGGER
jgi:hypothetical protein